MQFGMVFEGGGAKGTVFVGALQEVEARGHNPGRLLGTSAGRQATAAYFVRLEFSREAGLGFGLDLAEKEALNRSADKIALNSLTH